MRMIQEPFFQTKRILVIDQSAKTNDDRTWCFWEQGQGLFEPVVHHQWKQIDFFSTRFSARFDLDPYAYKMIRGIDFYDHVMQYAAQFPNVEFRSENVVSLRSEKKKALAVTEQNSYSADFIFNSILCCKHTL